jgi:hypothetical protein
MLIIDIDFKHGQVLPDDQVSAFVDSYIERYKSWEPLIDVSMVVGSEIIVDAVRLAIIEGKINSDNVQFKNGDIYSTVNEYGKLEVKYLYPSAHIDISTKILMLNRDKVRM